MAPAKKEVKMEVEGEESAMSDVDLKVNLEHD